MNIRWCYIFQMISDEFSHFMKYQQNRVVLITVRDTTSPHLSEIELDGSLKDQWDRPTALTHVKSLEDAVREARLHSPINFKGLVLVDNRHNRLVVHSYGYEIFARLKMLEAWEKEGCWEGEEEDGEVDYKKEREKCYLDLVLLFLQHSSQEPSRNRKHEKGKWKAIRKERKQEGHRKEEEPAILEQDLSEPTEDSSTTIEEATFTGNMLCIPQLGSMSTLTHTHTYTRTQPGVVPDTEFVQEFPEHRQQYVAVKEAFMAVCRLVDERYAELNSKHGAMQDWARQCEREKAYAPLLFILKKRGFKSAIQFYSDFEAVHERRVEKVAYYILQYMEDFRENQKN